MEKIFLSKLRVFFLSMNWAGSVSVLYHTLNVVRDSVVCTFRCTLMNQEFISDIYEYRIKNVFFFVWLGSTMKTLKDCGR